MYDEVSQYDQISTERTVRALSSLGIRQSPLTWERARRWAKQFEDGPEKKLAWLILRYLVFRTTDQIESSIRQALKKTAQHFSSSVGMPEETEWRDVFNYNVCGLKFYCSPPVGSALTTPGKSGELIARLINRTYKIDKFYTYNFTTFDSNDRLLIVDDGSFTGEQLDGFLSTYQPAKNYPSQIAIVLAIAHEKAISFLKERHPLIPIFSGEILLKSHCFKVMADSWVEKKIWTYEHCTPLEVYENICVKHNLGEIGDAGLGFGGLGVMLGYEHGIPDDSLRILWDRSDTWIPLIER
ncbi:phosphoribosyltransferase-like protein [Pseudomonas sp. 29]|uniref:phosphoribosyltransferase-like protein n=1 Tax=Pseudomonas TaxID=286 RepID=UPI000C17D675|nr:hypothetical protein [Pseudomonas sp. 29]PIF48434.1 hypothetical protein CLU80_0684 [Pseudomonas sp. 29]